MTEKKKWMRDKRECQRERKKERKREKANYLQVACNRDHKTQCESTNEGTEETLILDKACPSQQR